MGDVSECMGRGYGRDGEGGHERRASIPAIAQCDRYASGEVRPSPHEGHLVKPASEYNHEGNHGCGKNGIEKQTASIAWA